MASSTFRDSINSLGWSRRSADVPVTTSQRSGLLSSIQSLNPFGSNGYISLPTTEGGAPLPAPSRREEDEAWFILSRWDRLMIFGGCIIGAFVCFALCFFLFPVLSLRPSKFVTLWSFGSILFLVSFSAVMGPKAYLAHLLSGNRLPFTATYLGSIFFCLYSAIGLRSTILTLIAALIQLAALVWYLVSYFPMGSSGLRLVTTFGTRQAASWITG